MDSLPTPRSPTKRPFSGDAYTTNAQRIRLDSIPGIPGREGTPLPNPKSHTGKCIGVFTSGGDSQGRLHSCTL